MSYVACARMFNNNNNNNNFLRCNSPSHTTQFTWLNFVPLLLLDSYVMRHCHFHGLFRAPRVLKLQSISASVYSPVLKMAQDSGMGEQTTPQALSSEPAADQAAAGPSEQLPPPPQFPTDSFLLGTNQPDSHPKLAPNHSKGN